MADSYSSSKTSSVSFARPREKPEVTLDDVSAVVAGLNSKVLQLRREILALRDSPHSERSKGPEGYDLEYTKNKMAERGRYEEEERDYVNVKESKPGSKFIKKKSRLSGDFLRVSEDRPSSTPPPYLSQGVPIIKERLSSQQETRKMSSEREKRRQSSIVPIEGNEFTTSVKLTNGRSTNESSGRILSDASKNMTTQTFLNARRRSNISDQVSAEKSIPQSSKKSYNSQNRKDSKRNQNGGVREVEKNGRRLTQEDALQKSKMEPDKSRIVLPSRVSINCQGIRHALGLSTDYCNCDSTGSPVRRVIRKRISRGVQCDKPEEKKNKKKCGLGGCFAFKCCTAKPKASSRKHSRRSVERQKSLESTVTHKHRKNEYRKKSSEYKKNGTEGHEMQLKNRISGGGEENVQERFKHREILAPNVFQNGDKSQRHLHGMRRKMQAMKDQCVQKNDVTDVKRRLNECLIELNGIIGDVGYLFRETNS